MSKVVDGNEYVIVKEVAQLLRRSTTCVYRASDPDSPDPLPRIRIKRTLLYEVEDLRNWISRHKVESGDKLPGGDGNARDWRIRMSRRRYQAGFVRKRGKNVQTQYWEGNWREYVRGEAKPQRRSAKLGLAREMSKGDAKHKLSELLHEVNSPDHQPESPISLDEFWRRFEELVLPNKKHSTKRDMSNTYRLVLQARSRASADEEHQQGVTPVVLQSAVQELAYNTRKKVKIYLSSIFTHAVKYGYLRNNEVRSVDLGQRPPDTQPDLPTATELKMIEEALPEGKYRMFFQTVGGVGGRAGEISALRWGSFDLDRSVVWIRETVYDGKLGSPKTHRSTRPVDIPEELVQQLREYKKQFPNATDDDFVFPSQNGRDSDQVLKSSQSVASSDLQAARDNPNHLAPTAPLVWDGAGGKRSSAEDASGTDGTREHRDDDEVLRSCPRKIASPSCAGDRPRPRSVGEGQGRRFAEF